MWKLAVVWVVLFTLGPTAPAVCADEAGQAKTPPGGAEPFPTAKSTTLRGNGKVWYIDGLVTIPKKVEIGVEWGTKIVGINGAKLNVLGGLKVRGTQDHWVEFRDVDFSPTQTPHKGLHLDMVNFERCTFVHPEGTALDGKVTIENSTFQTGCTFDVRVRRGALALLTTVWRPAISIRCEPEDGRRPDILIQVRSSEFRAAVTVIGHGDVTLRHNAFKGGVTCKRMLTLMLDGCDIHDGLVVEQGPEDRFKKIKLTKCNVWNGAGVTLTREDGDDQKKERVFLQKFYFGTFDGRSPTTDLKAVKALVRDGIGKVTAKIDKPRARKHLLVNYDLWTTRPPQLHG